MVDDSRKTRSGRSIQQPQTQQQPGIAGIPGPPMMLRQIGEHKWLDGLKMSAAIGKAVIVCAHYGVHSDGYATVFVAYPDGRSRFTGRIPLVDDKLPKSLTDICATSEDIHNYDVQMGYIM